MIVQTAGPAIKTNKVTTEREQTYYCWKTVGGDWVRASFARVAQWQEKGVPYVLITHTWRSHRHAVNTHGDKDIVVQRITGGKDEVSDYLTSLVGILTILDQSDDHITVQWSF